jgi:hypothetical protein
MSGAAPVARPHAPLHRAVRLAVPIAGGEAVTVAARLVFDRSGALLRVVVPPPAGFVDSREAAARRVVAQWDAWLARPGQPGVQALLREAEALAAMGEQLATLEEQHGPGVAREAAA